MTSNEKKFDNLPRVVHIDKIIFNIHVAVLPI